MFGVVLIPGATIPLGEFGRHKWGYGQDYNEYVVYNDSQVCLRYLIQCKGEMRNEKHDEDDDDYTFKEYRDDGNHKSDSTNDDNDDDDDDIDEDDDYDDDDDDDDGDDDD